MNSSLTRLLTLAALTVVTAQVRAADPLTDAFVSPNLIMTAHELLGITPQQQTNLQEAFQGTQERMQKLQDQQKAEGEKLAAIASQTPVDEAAALAQADKVLDAERELKRTQLTLLIKIKNMLTPEQLAKVKEIKGHQASLQDKMREIQQAAQKWQENGGDPAVIEKVKAEVQAAMSSGKPDEALAALDRTLKLLTPKSGK